MTTATRQGQRIQRAYIRVREVLIHGPFLNAASYQLTARSLAEESSAKRDATGQAIK